MTYRLLLLFLAGLLIALALLWATDAPGADPIGPRFRQAQELMRAGRFAEAEPILRWILRTRPDLPRVQLDHALVLFRLGRDDEARELFLKVRRRPDLPAAVQRNVEDFLERIRARDPLHIGLDFGLWHDRNVNNASEAETVEIPVFGTRLPFRLNERPVSAWVARTGANVRWRKPVSPRAHIEVTSAVARNSAIGHSEYDRDTASLSVGPRIRYFVGGAGTRPLFGQVNMEVGVRKQWHGGHGHSHTGWIGLGVDQAVAPDWRIGAYVSRWVTGYNEDASSAIEPTGQSLYLGVSRRVGPGWLTLGGRMSGEHTKRENRRWAGREAILSYGATLWRDLGVSARASLGDREYDGKEALVQKQRKDDTYGLDVKLSHRALALEGFLPELNLGWSKTASTVVLYDRTTRTARLGMRRLF
ncbi:MAG: surface lipoprotein assembly modifier [Defluviicoccus sp.]|nr:surface lipoprotein assembly modifier [Defluviicoccus sp.]MDE0277441.1 surface lipoprotein assembly modifier [Defluviicoccus sp.]